MPTLPKIRSGEINIKVRKSVPLFYKIESKQKNTRPISLAKTIHKHTLVIFYISYP